MQLEFVAAHRHTDLLSHNIDVALRVGPIEDDQLIGRRLLSFRNVVYGSPELLASLDATPTLDTLGDCPCILGFDQAGRPITEWPLWAGGSVPVQGPIRSNNMMSRIDGARQGLGLTLASERLGRAWVEAGELVPVLRDEVGFMTPVALVWPATDFMQPKVRAFIDLAADVIGQLVKARP